MPRAARQHNIITTAHQNATQGVIWRGDSVIEGVPETLDMLRAMVRRCCVVVLLRVCSVRTAFLRRHLTPQKKTKK